MLPVSFLTKMRWSMDLHNRDTCVVGEAYGMDSTYVFGCEAFNRFSLEFESHFTKDRFAELDLTRTLFVQHWNERHGMITRSLSGKRRGLRWYDSFLRFDDICPVLK